jgi:hypothetical protein
MYCEKFGFEKLLQNCLPSWSFKMCASPKKKKKTVVHWAPHHPYQFLATIHFTWGQLRVKLSNVKRGLWWGDDEERKRGREKDGAGIRRQDRPVSVSATHSMESTWKTVYAACNISTKCSFLRLPVNSQFSVFLLCYLVSNLSVWCILLWCYYLLTPWSRVLPEKLKRPELLWCYTTVYTHRP